MKIQPAADTEYRFSPAADLEVRTAAGRPPKIVGYAAVYGAESADLGGFTEVIELGAFRGLIDSQEDVPATVEHDPLKLLGRRRAGTLKLAEDSHGLRMEIEPPNTTYARDLLESMKRGDIRGASFGFLRRNIQSEWRSKSGRRVHVIQSVRSLLDVSIVSTPAYPQASAGLRSAAQLAGRPFNLSTARAKLRMAAARLRIR